MAEAEGLEIALLASIHKEPKEPSMMVLVIGEA